MTKQRIILNAAQVEVAKRLGITPTAFAEAMALKIEEAEEELDQADPNNVEFYNVPVKTLRDLWLTKFGMAWVNNYDVDDDERWGVIAHRLCEYNLMETDLQCEWRKLREEV